MGVPKGGGGSGFFLLMEPELEVRQQFEKGSRQVAATVTFFWRPLPNWPFPTLNGTINQTKL